MNINEVNSGAFANGFSCFCANCHTFFSVQIMDEYPAIDEVEYCPSCGCNELISDTEELLNYCNNNYADPANFYTAFPPDEPIPWSCTGATPQQVKIIESLVILDLKGKRPVSVESTAAESGLPSDLVAAVFKGLNIAESEAAA